jgi:CBS domain-containing protein
VEDEHGHLTGLITTRKLLRYYIHRGRIDSGMDDYKTVADLMIAKPTTIGPQTTIKEAMEIMRGNKLGCLPVVKEDELVGIITEMDFLRVAGRLIDRLK